MVVVIRYDQGFFTGARGVRIYHRSWEPDDAVLSRVTISHGYAEHGERYAHVATRLAERGFAVSALDHRGHGQSGGDRVNVKRFSDYTDDLHSFLVIGAQRWPGVRSILLGHSMGGMIALDLALGDASDIDALVLSAPAVCPPKVAGYRVTAGKVLARVTPGAPVLRLPLNKISKDKAVVKAYKQDKLVFRSMVHARLAAEWLAAMARVEENLPALRMPLLVMQGSDDGLVDPGCGPHVVERAGSADKTLKMYPGLWHEIFNEPEREMVISDLISWVTPHAGIGTA
ncbi:MAG: lysophospholipase [Candidatus Dormibacteria bacterium]